MAFADHRRWGMNELWSRGRHRVGGARAAGPCGGVTDHPEDSEAGQRVNGESSPKERSVPATGEDPGNRPVSGHPPATGSSVEVRITRDRRRGIDRVSEALTGVPST